MVCREPAASHEHISDKDGRRVVSTAATNRRRLGDRIRLTPGRCDATIKLYDWYVSMRRT
jgi:D-serine deaminase-like pyridoxal phosphate-dependent protein